MVLVESVKVDLESLSMVVRMNSKPIRPPLPNIPQPTPFSTGGNGHVVAMAVTMISLALTFITLSHHH